MQRIAAVWHASPQKVVGALFALLLAATMAVGSGASFNATSANAGNVVTAGDLKHTNTGGVLLNIDKLKPGETRNGGTVTLENTGDIDGVFSLAMSGLSDTLGTGGGQLSDRVRVKIDEYAEDGSGAPTTRYNNYIDQLTSPVALGTWAPNEGRQYRFSVTFVDGTPAVVNPYKTASSAMTFDWESVSN